MAYPIEEGFGGDWTENVRYLCHLNNLYLKTVGKVDFSNFMKFKFKEVLSEIKEKSKSEEGLRKNMSLLYENFDPAMKKAITKGEKLSVVSEEMAKVIAQKRVEGSSSLVVDFKEMERANALADRTSKAHLKAKTDYKNLWALKDNPYILEKKLKAENLASEEVRKVFKDCLEKSKAELESARQENFVYLAESQILTQENILTAERKEERQKASTKLIVKARKKPTIKEKYSELKPIVIKRRIREMLEQENV